MKLLSLFKRRRSRHAQTIEALLDKVEAAHRRCRRYDEKLVVVASHQSFNELARDCHFRNLRTALLEFEIFNMPVVAADWIDGFAVVSESDLKELVGRLGGVVAFGSDINLFTRQFREWNKQ
jgi:hypothetical protein